MNSSKDVCCISLVVIIFLSSVSSWAKTAPQTQIHVTLLGQPCLLEGPFDEITLKAIHSLGPAQLYPNITPSDPTNSKDQTRKTLEKLRSSSLPSLLDRYRERLSRRLEAQLAFLEALDSFIKMNKAGPLLKAGKRYLRDREMKGYETQLKKIHGPRKNTSQFRDAVDQLMETFNEGIEKDPEEDFHRAIKRMDVQYTCTFEENEE